MDFLTLARERQSIRGFAPQDVPHEIVLEILEAASQAPSGGNRQPWHFFAVKDPVLWEQLYEKAYHADWFRTAPLVMAVCMDAERSGERYGERGRTLYAVQDTGAAIQSMLLCAWSRGVGSCWCGAFDEDAAAEVLALPERLRPVALIPMGFPDPACRHPKPARRPPADTVTFLYGGGAPAESPRPAGDGIRFEHCDLGGAVFDDVNLGGARFNNINMQGVSFGDINMREASFGDMTLEGAQFGSMDMRRTGFENADFTESTLSNCNLSGVRLERCDTTGLTINGVPVETPAAD